jgi:hypothetical protein
MELYSDPAVSKYLSGGKLNYGRQIPIDSPGYVKGTAKPEESWHFFTPASFGVKLAPEQFRRQIKEIDPRFEVIWHPFNERWVVWAHLPQEIKHPRMKGWKLIMVVQYQEGEYMPLDERTLARAWDRCGRKHNGFKKYWDRIEEEQDRTHDNNLAKRRDEVRYMAGEQWDHQKIQISMHGKSSGSKFSKHHSGG